MSPLDFTTESPENFEQKCCCALVLDVSGSMKNNPINELNEGLQEFYRDIQTDSTTANRLEVAVIEFSDVVKTLINPSLVANFTMPTLTVKGKTHLVDGVREGIKLVSARKSWYKSTRQPYYRPWVILITDGAPDPPGQDIAGLAREIKEGVNKGEFFFFALGVDGADMKMLNSISDAKMPPQLLRGLKFSEFFRWLSASMSMVTKSKETDEITFPSPSDWVRGVSV